MDDGGFKAFLMSAQLGAAMKSVADDLAAQANRSGRSEYESRRSVVSGGRDNSPRAGAEVVESRRSWPDVRARHLLNVTKLFRVRGGG